jgi:GINS complex protein
MRAGHFEISDSTFTPEELEFFAEEELITIVPKISTIECSDQGEPGHLPLLSGARKRCSGSQVSARSLCVASTMTHVEVSYPGSYGKFEPNQLVDVPIWLAIELRKRNQCSIKLPPWMGLNELREVISKEQTDMSSFQPLPFHYVEVCCSE